MNHTAASALTILALAPQLLLAQDSLATKGLPLEPTRTVSMTTDRGSWMSLDVSPDGSTIVFDLLGDLYTMPTSGGMATPLMVGPAFEAQPRFSPDGSEIVFVSDRSGGQNLWVLATDGSDTTQLTSGNGHLYTSPEWTPDGTYVVASRTFSPLGGAAKPFLFHRDGGSGLALVDEPTNLKLIGPAFDPDGRYIYMAQGTGDWTYDALFPEYQLVRYDRQTGTRTSLTSRYGSGFRPALSPDGSTLVYGTRHEDATGLRVRDLDSGQERWLVYPVQRDDMESRATLDILPGYAFVPDGSALIASYDGGFWRIPIDGSTPSAIPFTADVTVHLGPRLDFDYAIEDTPTFLARQIRNPVPSPDGASVAMTVLGQLYITEEDGSNPRRVAQDVGGLLSGPAWSPDGRRIAVTSWDEPEGGFLWTVDARSGDADRVSADPRYIHSAAWSPDGRRIVVLQAPVAARLGGGAGAVTEIVWYPEDGGDAAVVAPARGRGSPHFRTAESDRIYLFGGSDGLISIRWDGTDPKAHLKVTGFSRSSGGSPGNASWIGMAPTGDRAIARVENDLYLLTVPRIGAEGPTISVRNPESAAFPVTRLTDVGGEFPAWSSNGREVTWTLGRTLFRYDIDRAEVVADSIAEAERAEADADERADEDEAADPAEASQDEESDDSSDEEPGYEPDEFPISVPITRDLPEGTVVLRGARVVTMVGDEVIEGGDVVVQGNRIRAVGPTGSVDIPAGATIRDVSGMTILPGFVDTHAHMRPPSGVHTTQPWPYLANLAFGVTTTRDPQTGVSDVLTYSDRVRAGQALGPRVYSTGPGVFGSYQGESIRDLDHARDILRRYAEYYDTKTFKMYLAGNRQQRQWLIMAARELELMPTTEAGIDFQLDLTQAMDGYPGIEHNLPVYPLYDDVVTLFAEAKVVNTPTLIVSFGGPMGEIYWFTRETVHDDERLRRFTPHETLDGRTRRRAGGAGAVGWAMDEEFVFEEHARFLRDVVAAGGFAGVGSHGQLQGLGFHWEMWMLGQGGMSNHDVLRSATIFGANGIGLESELGSIEPGKLADLVLLSENPLADLRATTSVEQVMMNGRIFDADALTEVWPRQREVPYRGFVDDEPAVRPSG
jgi:WD40 repeat protein